MFKKFKYRLKKGKYGCYRATFEQALYRVETDTENPKTFLTEEAKNIYVSWVMIRNNADYTHYDSKKVADFMYCAIAGEYYEIRPKGEQYCSMGAGWTKLKEPSKHVPTFLPPILTGEELKYWEKIHPRNDPRSKYADERTAFGLSRWPEEYWEDWYKDRKSNSGKTQKQSSYKTVSDNSDSDVEFNTSRFKDKKTEDRYTKWQNMANNPAASKSEREFALRRMMSVDESR